MDRTEPADTLTELLGTTSTRSWESLADGVYFQLREAITTGALPSGYRLREVALARHFGVSTTPVREVLRRLEREGLVEISLHRGAMVAQLRPERWMDLFEVRQVLAAHAIRRACEVEHRDFSRVEAILAECESIVHSTTRAHFGQLDVAFHRALNDLAGNQELSELAENLHWRIQGLRIRYADSIARHMSESHQEHLAMVEAVKSRDAARAEQLALSHAASVRDAIHEILKREAGVR